MGLFPTPEFCAARLREAVRSRGITWAALAEDANVKPSTLSEYKSGITTPSPEQLSKIATALEYPDGFFLRPGPVGSELVGPRLFRSNSAMTKRAAEQAESRLALMSECIVFAERLLSLPEPTFLKAYENISDPWMLDYPQIEAIALSVREKLGFGARPITNFVRTLEKAGIAVLRYSTLAKIPIDGLSQHTAIGRPLCAIFASEKSSLSREYFSLAHELGHIVLHARVNGSRFDDLADAKFLENQANRFAGSFLLPAAPFLAALAAPTLSFFEYLKKDWRASIATMIMRAFDLGRIDREQCSALFIKLSQKRWRQREPLDDVFEIEQPILLKQVFTTLAQREGVQGARVAKELHRNPADLAAISGLPGSFFADEPTGPNVIAFAG